MTGECGAEMFKISHVKKQDASKWYNTKLMSARKFESLMVKSKKTKSLMIWKKAKLPTPYSMQNVSEEDKEDT